MSEHRTDLTQNEDIISDYLLLLEDESVSGAIQILLNALLVWSRTCHYPAVDSMDTPRSLIPSQARQRVYSGINEVDFTSHLERRPYRKPPSPSADRLKRLIHHISDYALALSFENAVAFFTTLMARWIKVCSVESIVENAQVTGRPINLSPSDEELTKALRHTLNYFIFEYESLDAARS